jgi:hypothetical protein
MNRPMLGVDRQHPRQPSTSRTPVVIEDVDSVDSIESYFPVLART